MHKKTSLTLLNDIETTYVIVTPCYNEEQLIHYPLRSVVTQTKTPKCWLIVDDDSTDSTAQCIKNFTDNYLWIEYVFNKKVPGETYYSSNVYAILRGVNQLKNIPYSYLAILDADIELCDDYYQNIIAKFQANPKLGVATGVYLEKEGNTWVEAKIDRRSTPKAIQVFRRECYEQCGGYLPFKHGGEDSGMEVLARMNGWETWSFNDITVKHHRPVGTGDGRSLLKARYRLGTTDYCLGTHPLFMVIKCLKRMSWEKPYILSGIARLLGYVIANIKRYQRPLPKEAIQYLRYEQLQRITPWKRKE